MKKTPPEQFRATAANKAFDPRYLSTAEDGMNGSFVVPYLTEILRVIVSDGEGWEHVSVSLRHRCPTWGEMCYIKDLFWEAEECVIQYHPPKSEYVNCHPFCLHLWRPTAGEILLPPKCFVG